MSESTPPPAAGAPDATPAPSGELRNFPSAWAEKKKTPLSWLHAARAHAKWEPGVSLITESEFDEAVAAVQDIRIDAVHGPSVVRPGEEK